MKFNYKGINLVTEHDQAVLKFCSDVVTTATDEWGQIDFDYIAKQVLLRIKQPEIEDELRNKSR